MKVEVEKEVGERTVLGLRLENDDEPWEVRAGAEVEEEAAAVVVVVGDEYYAWVDLLPVHGGPVPFEWP